MIKIDNQGLLAKLGGLIAMIIFVTLALLVFFLVYYSPLGLDKSHSLSSIFISYDEDGQIVRYLPLRTYPEAQYTLEIKGENSYIVFPRFTGKDLVSAGWLDIDTKDEYQLTDSSEGYRSYLLNFKFDPEANYSSELIMGHKNIRLIREGSQLEVIAYVNTEGVYIPHRMRYEIANWDYDDIDVLINYLPPSDRSNGFLEFYVHGKLVDRYTFGFTELTGRGELKAMPEINYSEAFLDYITNPEIHTLRSPYLEGLLVEIEEEYRELIDIRKLYDKDADMSFNKELNCNFSIYDLGYTCVPGDNFELADFQPPFYGDFSGEIMEFRVINTYPIRESTKFTTKNPDYLEGVRVGGSGSLEEVILIIKKDPIWKD